MKVALLFLIVSFLDSCYKNENSNFYSLDRSNSYQYIFSNEGEIIKLVFHDKKTEMLIFDARKRLVDNADVIFPYQFEIDSVSLHTIYIKFNSFSKDQKEIMKKFNPSEHIKFVNNSNYGFSVNIKDLVGSASIPQQEVDSFSFGKKRNQILLYQKDLIIDTLSINNLFIDSGNTILKSFEKDTILITRAYVVRDGKSLLKH